jgi:hypothetical protein
VARAPEENESEHRQQKSFASSGNPILSGRNVAAEEEEGREHDQETVARHPYESELCPQHRA